MAENILASEVNPTKIHAVADSLLKKQLFATGKFSVVINRRERLSRIMKINREMCFCYEKMSYDNNFVCIHSFSN